MVNVDFLFIITLKIIILLIVKVPKKCMSMYCVNYFVKTNAYYVWVADFLIEDNFFNIKL